jgi:hypothetical protein
MHESYCDNLAIEKRYKMCSQFPLITKQIRTFLGHSGSDLEAGKVALPGTIRVS